MKQTVPFSASTAHGRSEVVLSLAGDIDAATAPTFAREAELMGGGPDVTLVFDMTGVTFIDSTGLSVIAGTLRRLRSVGGRLCIRGASPMLCRLLQISGIDECANVEIVTIFGRLPTTAPGQGWAQP